MKKHPTIEIISATLKELCISEYNISRISEKILGIAQNNYIDVENIDIINYIATFIEDEGNAESPLDTMYWDKQGYSRSVARSLAKLAFDSNANTEIQRIEELWNDRKKSYNLHVYEGLFVDDLEKISLTPQVGVGYISSDFENLKDIWTVTRVQESADGTTYSLYMERYLDKGKTERRVIEAFSYDGKIFTAC